MTGEPSAYHGVEDHELVRRHVAGDRGAFGELVRRHQDRLWAIALRTVGNHEEAADALQDGLINAFRRASSFRAESAVTTWLHRVVVNACLDRIRHAAARPSDPVAFDGTEPQGSMPTAEQGSDPAERMATRLDLEAALATLPAEQRVPLVLVDMEGYRVAEVAEMLDLPAGTIKSRCARGRARLLPLLAGRNSPDTDGNQTVTGGVPPAETKEQGGDRR
ncbi:RNA polymerase sigma factor SigM [Actinobacteria bacterium YIM 96077]|uniref:RNA polymerase sigma factor SigM n=1 Tax=Phytoactinopolyspora halophila TaxID=1981511 RepID=A0A329QQS5_9ACTN|nr:RNA polymerase sigma factor SigM [Phytoactinopolyspora halophila]AYY15100.1 RNA polymerase sigma factor SigM [Actinobacteria bacterium YIM 96077]RAW14720.1 RNA polymerase sigma factor SigM [Phytoactinopolyspora halophila]